jgi:N-acetyl-anhydromuramyl-L-alanine amidase AmpD
MKITETGLKFTGLKVRSSTKRIIVHHSASVGDEDAATIHRWHLGQGWAGIGYHYVIRKSGEIQRGRPEGAVGAHAGTAGNPNSIGVCLVGNFEQTPPEGAQLQSLVWLIRDVSERYGSLTIIGHRDVMATACPGRLFPWDRLKELLAGSAQKVKLTVNERAVQVPLRVVDGRTEALMDGTWVQLRTLAGTLGAGIDWDEKTKTVNLEVK